MSNFLHLFLDFDGVLHHHPEDGSDIPKPFEHVPALTRVIDDADPDKNVRVAITSDWRKHLGLDELKGQLGESIAERVVGVTPVFKPTPMPWGGVLSRGIRQQEIETWLKNNAPEAPWVALDDRADLFRYRCPHLVEVAPTSKGGRGLNPMALQALHQMLLARMPNEPEPKAKFRP